MYLYNHVSNQKDKVNEVGVDPNANEVEEIMDPSADSAKGKIMDEHQNNASGWDPTYFQFETVLHLLTYVLFWSLQRPALMAVQPTPPMWKLWMTMRSMVVLPKRMAL